MRLFRLAKIVSVSLRFGLDRMVLDADSSGRLAHIWHKVFFWRTYSESRGARLRQALELTFFPELFDVRTSIGPGR